MLRVCFAVALTAALLAAESRGAESPSIRRVAVTGQAVPGGGTFDRFSVESLPIVAPINSKGQVAFFATIVRGRANEGFFIASGGRVDKLVADGDRADGRGFSAARLGDQQRRGEGDGEARAKHVVRL